MTGANSKNPTLADIQRDLKSARDMALLGNYVESEKQYSSIITSISGIVSNRPPDDRSARKWEQVLKQIQEELEPVRQIKSEWASMGEFGAPTGGEKAGSETEAARCNMLDDFFTASMVKDPQRKLHQHNDEVSSNQPVWDGVIAPPSPRTREERGMRDAGDFGARLPARHRSSDSADLPGWAQGRESPVAKPKRAVQSRPERDVGGPVSRGGGGGSLVAGRQRSSNVGTNSGENSQGGRNYTKPWLDNAPSKGKGKDNKAPAKDSGNTSSFIEHLYGPSGKGPDTDLISSLEKDCVEKSPQVQWDSIAGLVQAKSLLEEAVVLPLMMPDYFTGIRRAWKGVLMFGPPGTGKTMLAKAVATQCETAFFNVSAASMASKYRGDSEKLVRILFEMARWYAPTTIFFDEIDALGSKRGDGEHEASRRVKAELLVQMDGVSNGDSETEEKKQVTVLAATNRPWDLDEALRRRLEKRIYIPLPEAEGRKQLFEINLRNVKLGPDVKIDDFVNGTQGYSGADVTLVCREAAMMGLRQRLAKARAEGVPLSKLAQMQKEVDTPVTQVDFQEALKNVSKSVGNEDLQKFTDWMKEFGSV